MRNKLIVLLLCGAMTMGALTGCGNTDSTGDVSEDKQSSEATNSSETTEESGDVSEEKCYDDKLTITMTGVNTQVGLDYEDDYMHYIEDMFNVDLEIMGNEWDGAAERFTLQTTGGSLHDLNLWLNFDWSGYYEYAEQGLFKAMPEDWAERWPDLYNMVDDTGFLEYLTVDGNIYALPHAALGNQVDVDSKTLHTALYLRKDWASEVGMADLGAEGYITLDELRAYLVAVGEAGLASKPVIATEGSIVTWIFEMACGVPSTDFLDEGDGYIWSPTHPKYVTMIETMQEWYADGLIDADFYSKSAVDYRDEFCAGQTAAFAYSGDPGNASQILRSFETANPDKTFGDSIIMLQLADENGVVYAQEDTNYWTATVFSPDIDETVFERALDMMNWICTTDGEFFINMGIPEIDWTYGDDGLPVMLEGSLGGEAEYTNSFLALVMCGYCADDFTMCEVNPYIDDAVLSMSTQMVTLRDEGYIFPLAKDYILLASDSKDIYNGAIDLNNLIVKIVCSEDDVETSLTAYMEENREIWETLLNELNEFAGY